MSPVTNYSQFTNPNIKFTKITIPVKYYNFHYITHYDEAAMVFAIAHDLKRKGQLTPERCQGYINGYFGAQNKSDVVRSLTDQFRGGYVYVNIGQLYQFIVSRFSEMDFHFDSDVLANLYDNFVSDCDGSYELREKTEMFFRYIPQIKGRVNPYINDTDSFDTYRYRYESQIQDIKRNIRNLNISQSFK